MVEPHETIHRRDFLGSLAATAVGLSALAFPARLLADQKMPPSASNQAEFEKWLGRIKGKHRQVYDAPSTNGGLPLAWARVFLMSNSQLGVKEKDMTSVLVLRHDAIPYAMGDEMWQKYSFGENFNIKNMMTKARQTSNIYWKPKEDLPIPGMSVDKLLESGVLIGVCDLALSFDSMHMASKMNLDAAEVKKEWVANIFPGIQIVPSGVIAVNRAQEHGCTYCFAGGEG